jgi:putative tricarboxylic transport membrane protein
MAPMTGPAGRPAERTSARSLLPFFTRPVCAVLAAITILSILWSIPAVNQATRGLFRRQPG